ncbi:MAG TPA: hypothetical protein VK363_03585 [Pyrinomonadaceae bacterium]|nr:hypothetical protein [Pyrinomonadaceae bacterium]
MSENLEAILNAARRLPVEQQRELVERLLKDAGATKGGVPEANGVGNVRRYFGTWDSGDTRSADNERIDEDLAREYGNTQEAHQS